ncbi:MAG: hypothetical protein AMXMBFR59_22540 [Rhodanobacteraceae bacterium]
MIKQLLMDEFRFLTFRRMSPAIRDHWKAFLVFGLTFTWLAGVGRYWDNPRAHVWQYLGLGSLAYVVVLALIIWALVAPLRPRNWSYRNVLLFITLTAPPAMLYAIPVERFLTSGDAVVANIAFLATVASWRVVLYALFLKRTAGLSLVSVIVCTLLPLTIIVVTLTALNLEHVVFKIMGGLRPDEQTANDGAYSVVVLLSLLSVMLAPVLLLAYAVLVYRARYWANDSAGSSRRMGGD